MNRTEAKASVEIDKTALAWCCNRICALQDELKRNEDERSRLSAMITIKEAFAAGGRIELVGIGEVNLPAFDLPASKYRILEPPPKKTRDLTPADLPDHPCGSGRETAIQFNPC